ncbi:uncharacterized protein LOC121379161 [Gigantopelta aegis]|uniref:uncharacterized protein LOC121379161 n=1 Tax=Gigantopelta aegis TaxID=1735272 RepID=UPI001B887583|nr:uncharacterized protein LOC121379161 [Gigantopelta aegis]
MEVVKAVQEYLHKNVLTKDMKWWVQFRKPENIMKHQDTFLYCEILLYVMAFLTLVHAIRNGGRFWWLWVAALFHGLTVECVSYFLPEIDNFWHAQSMVMLIGQRLPFHIVLLYPAFYYIASVAVSHMNLRWWAEPFAVGLSVVLLDVPYDIMGVKLLWWTWHDDDPNIFDRHYWVPWTSYYFHATFAAGFTFVFHGLRSFCSQPHKFQSSGFIPEFIVAVMTGVLAMPCGMVQFLPVYHPLHDLYHIHTEVCVLLLLAAYLLIVWSADRVRFQEGRPAGSRYKFNEVTLAVFLHYLLYIYLVIKAEPNKIRSLGFHQPVGSCTSEPVAVQTPFGHTLQKQKYLCVEKYSEDYFDFHCVKKPPVINQEWYTICGTPFVNHVEYILVVAAFCVLGLFWYWQLLFRSGVLPRSKVAHRKLHRE